MDTMPRIQALQTAKVLIGSHGLVAHMNKYNRDVLARELRDDTIALRCEFHLDPARNGWADNNPSASLSIMYASDPRGSRIDETGAMVVDNFLQITISASSGDMQLDIFRRRENMLSMVGMLCEMLQQTLPQKLTLVMETPELVAANARKSFEQQVGQQIFTNIGVDAFKGLRRDGASRSHRLTSTYTSPDGKYPETGTYRFRHVRVADRRGHARDVAYYSIRVFGSDGTVPPTVSIRRISAPE
jgi:hypothetical protein